jgi:hypothetical protein
MWRELTHLNQIADKTHEPLFFRVPTIRKSWKKPHFCDFALKTPPTG